MKVSFELGLYAAAVICEEFSQFTVVCALSEWGERGGRAEIVATNWQQAGCDKVDFTYSTETCSPIAGILLLSYLYCYQSSKWADDIGYFWDYSSPTIKCGIMIRSFFKCGRIKSFRCKSFGDVVLWQWPSVNRRWITFISVCFRG